MSKKFFALTCLSAVLALSMPVMSEATQGASAQASVTTMVAPKALLSDGRWLEAVGATTAVVDAQGRRTALPAGLLTPREGHSLTVLPDGRVLVLGGKDANGTVLSKAEAFDPATGRFSALEIAGLLPRALHSAAVLGDGRVLITGGVDARGTPLVEAELWNPMTSQVERFNVRLQSARLKHLSSLLPSNAVLVWGGVSASGAAINGAEAYDVQTQRFVAVNDAQALVQLRALDGAQAPAVQASTPASEAHQVPVSQPLIVRFNKRMNVASLNSANVTLIGPEGAVAVKPVAVEQGVLLFVWPGKQLLPSSRYTLFINGAADNAGQRLALTAIGFDTESLGAGAVDGGKTEAQPVATTDKTGAAKAPTAEDKVLAEMLADDEYFVPGAEQLKGDWFSGRAALARQSMPRRAEVREAIYGHQERLLKLLQGKPGQKGEGQSLGVYGEAVAARPAAAGLLRLNWADTQSQLKAERQAAAIAPTAGTTAVAGQLLKLNGKPLAKATLRLNGLSAQTDDNGEFFIANAPAGASVLEIDGRSANTAQASYGVFHYQVQVQAGRVNALPFVVWMPKLDMKHAINIESPLRAEKVLTHPRMPGVQVVLPAGSVIRDADGKIVTRVSLTPIPVDQAPFPMPYAGVPVYYTLQPGGAVIQGVDGKPRAATVRYPNYTRFGPGEQMRLFDYDPHAKGWYVYSDVQVSADGKSLASKQPLQVYQFALHSVSSGGTKPDPDQDPKRCDGGNGDDGAGEGGWDKNASSAAGADACGGDPVSLTTGRFTHMERDMMLPDVIPVDILRSYNSQDITGKTASVRAFGFGTSHPYENFLVFRSDYGDITLVLHNGSKVLFKGTTTNTYHQVYTAASETGEFRHATVQPIDSYFVLIYRDGRQWGFSKMNARLVWMDDANGNRLAISRPNTNSYASRITTPNGRWVDFTYGADGRVATIADHTGRSFEYSYENNRLKTVKDPAEKTRQYVWSTIGGLLEEVWDPNNKRMVKNTYEVVSMGIQCTGGVPTKYQDYETGRVKRQVLADDTTFDYDYSTVVPGQDTCTWTSPLAPPSKVTVVTDRRGIKRKAEFDDNRFMVRNTAALGKAQQQVTNYETVDGLTKSITDARNRKTTFDHDEFGNVKTITRLAGTTDAVTTSITWHPVFNKPKTVTDPNQITTTFDYDDKGNLVKVTGHLKHEVNFSYDAQGRPETVTNALNKTTTLGYDGADLASVLDPLDRKTQYLTDALGRTLTTISPMGQATYRDWDKLNRLLSVTDALGNSASFIYDDNGKVLTHKDQKLNPTHYTYHPSGQVKTKEDALGKLQKDLYEGGLLKRRTDRNGQVSGVTYDDLGRVHIIGYGATETSPEAYKSTVTLTWDNGNRLVQIDDVVGGKTYITKRVYDELDRLEQETTPQGEVNYTYDAGGRRETMRIKNGAPGSQVARPLITYTWDKANRLRQIDQAAGAPNGNAPQVIKFDYDDANQRTKTTLANGASVNYKWDDAGQLESIRYRKADDSLMGEIVYGYDGDGRRISANGNMARVNLPEANVTDMQYDANNRLKRWAGKDFSYDDNGNLLADGVNTFQWDERNQLASIGLGGSQVAKFQYDAQGRRAAKTIDGTTTGFLYGGLSEANMAQELLGDTNTAAVKSHIISAGIDETLLREISGKLHSVLPDGNNNTVRLLDGAQAKVVDYAYEPYGRTSADANNANTQQYTGRENDDLTNNGLYYYRNRYYMPGCMRFISEDPIGWASGQTNNYAYVGGDPVSLVDPLGLGDDWFRPKDRGYRFVDRVSTWGGKLWRGFGYYNAFQGGCEGALAYKEYSEQTENKFDGRYAGDQYTPAQRVAEAAEGVSNFVDAFGRPLTRVAIGIGMTAYGGGLVGVGLGVAAAVGGAAYGTITGGCL
ncbi:MAG TPA: RHS repeat-associated core domain-containing protein [Ideonella sp.]|uniref:RHS repeat-associated core domain-containing protein n=1 Tax=Ideonella sp. TaxID=1929293 RepID=UPI002E3220A2|nr:RHS repeat-associated core domain-containing protein [Ideonella sp.]HEX5685597.1 RHS repeat-associated core domain-containing protein [Ideonella sp.]